MLQYDLDQVKEYRQFILGSKAEIGKVIVGLDDVVEKVLIAVLCNGHVLLEGVPGLGKTMLVNTMSQVFRLKFARIQFTPDLMPADITGTNILMEDKSGRRYFQFQPGPLFAQLILADEINRATAKTQSALLEAMQEGSVTVAGQTRMLEQPFFVIATQNPIELEGTYPLPEAQVDRFFFKLKVDYPSLSELNDILKRTTSDITVKPESVITGDELKELQQVIRQIPIADPVIDYASRVVLATHPTNNALNKVKQYVRYGASPRAAQSLVLAGKAAAFLAGRYNVDYQDIKAVAAPSLRHRIMLNFEGQAAQLDIDLLIKEIIDNTAELRK